MSQHSQESFQGIKIYPPNTHVVQRGSNLSGQYYIDKFVAENPEATHLIRAVGVDVWSLLNNPAEFGDLDLKTILRIADEELEDAAAKIEGEADVVEHTWGLWSPHQSNARSNYIDQCALPEAIDHPVGHIVVAEVIILRGVQPVQFGLSKHFDRVKNGFCDYSHAEGKRIVMKDISPSQALASNDNERTTIADIEPRLRAN